MANAKCHFPENLSQFENEACFVGDLGMYKMVDITKTAGADISFRFENPRNDPKKILIATEPTVPLLPPNEERAHLRTIDQFENLCKSYPSLVFGPIADTSLFSDWNAYRRDSTDVFKKYDDVLYLGCSRDLIMNELHNEMEYKGTETHANHLYHGGCLSFMPGMTNTDKVAGILLYPSGAAMDILNCLRQLYQGVQLVVPSKQLDVLNLFLDKTQNAALCHLEGKGYSIVRTDYQCHLVKFNLCEDGDVTAVTIVESINTQHRPTSVAVSPFLPTEHICALDSGEVILSESSGRLLRSAEFPQDDRKINPIFSHFGAHPREAFIHDHHEALLYDFRSPKHTKNSIFELPSFCLPFGQAFCVARQHPTNHFYHYIATQDVLLLLDQRFPQHTVFQTCHNGRGMPSYLEVSSCKEAENMHIVMVGNHASKQVHCFFVENEMEAVPRLFSLPWKVGRFDEWLEVVDGAKPSGNPKLWERLSEPLLGLSACPVTAGDDVNSWNVLQISGAGDMFCQTFHSPAGDDHIPKQKSVDELSRKLCDLWIKSCCNEQDVKVQAPQQCRKRTSIEYHPPCERCQSKDCILGAKSNHGMKETVLRLKNRPKRRFDSESTRRTP
ncbi:putative TATA box-binding protein-associated factor RNA polymerase I subunit C [Apostichopus japonicus]|uniref:Putative TATA box-binding protein-associated factor RNA polymerase I subunit C n=1 Tax=Stichopus japonicus TaxID=307972 RepID=A0A2G8JHU5_STIJA|nr:putative TATA box-binding protein-associated factor RNA polymerase I subunit C [Apostichopus japonicus]